MDVAPRPTPGLLHKRLAPPGESLQGLQQSSSTTGGANVTLPGLSYSGPSARPARTRLSHLSVEPPSNVTLLQLACSSKVDHPNRQRLPELPPQTLDLTQPAIPFRAGPSARKHAFRQGAERVRQRDCETRALLSVLIIATSVRTSTCQTGDRRHH